MYPAQLLTLAQTLLDAGKARGFMIATAESCTGGLLAACLTEISGSSAVFDRGYVTYSNAAKMEVLGVPEALLAAHGAVSLECAKAMATGALTKSRATIALSITGVAGPSGGSFEKPVGFVCFGLAAKNRETESFFRNFGDLPRSEIRLHSVAVALGTLHAAMDC